MNVFRITRQYKFEMSHALFWLEEKQPIGKYIYGRAVNPHGHNWRLDVTVEGTKDYRSHMIYDLNNLDKLVAREIDNRYDHKYFDINNFDQVPTLENLTKVMFNSLREKDTHVKSITLYEEPNVYATYSGGGNMYVTHVYKFNAQHRTHNPKLHQGLNDQFYGKCNRYHGHSYELSVTVKGMPNNRAGLVINHARLDKAIYDLIGNQLDYKNLNELPELEEGNATTENLLEALWGKVQKSLKDHTVIDDHCGTTLYRLRLKETDRNIFDYFGPDNEDLM